VSAHRDPAPAGGARLVFERDWVTVASFRDLAEAEMARVTLDAEGIRCYLADAELIRLDWTLSTALGGIKLRVPARDRERALGRLHRTSSSQALRLVREPPDETDAPRCPACGTPAPSPLDRARRISLAAVLLGLPLLLRFGSARCGSCGRRRQRGS
jgi:hypothetical protein